MIAVCAAVAGKLSRCHCDKLGPDVPVKPPGLFIKKVQKRAKQTEWQPQDDGEERAVAAAPFRLVVGDLSLRWETHKEGTSMMKALGWSPCVAIYVMPKYWLD